MTEEEYRRGAQLLKPIVCEGIARTGYPVDYILGDAHKAIQKMSREDLEIVALHAISAFMKGTTEIIKAKRN